MHTTPAVVHQTSLEREVPSNERLSKMLIPHGTISNQTVCDSDDASLHTPMRIIILPSSFFFFASTSASLRNPRCSQPRSCSLSQHASPVSPSPPQPLPTARTSARAVPASVTPPSPNTQTHTNPDKQAPPSPRSPPSQTCTQSSTPSTSRPSSRSPPPPPRRRGDLSSPCPQVCRRASRRPCKRCGRTAGSVLRRGR